MEAGRGKRQTKILLLFYVLCLVLVLCLLSEVCSLSCLLALWGEGDTVV